MPNICAFAGFWRQVQDILPAGAIAIGLISSCPTGYAQTVPFDNPRVFQARTTAARQVPATQAEQSGIELTRDGLDMWRALEYTRSGLDQRQFSRPTVSPTRSLDDPAMLYERCAPGVVLLVSPDRSSIGAGAVTPDGEIVTNWHVVQGHRRMCAIAYDSSISTLKDVKQEHCEWAEVFAVDKSRDLALLKPADSTPPRALAFGDDSKLKIGGDVFAIGHPEQFVWSFTQGYVSQFRPKFEWAYGPGVSFRADIIQSATPTNPGNSGGPLFNAKGEMVGINSFKSSEGEGLHFAIRLNEVRDFIRQAHEGKLTLPAEDTVPAALGSWIPLDGNENGTTDAYGMDTDGDDYFDTFQFDENEDGQIDFLGGDSNGDRRIDYQVHDKDGDGHFESWLIDSDFDGTPDSTAVDTDGDGKPDSFSKIEP